MTFKQCPGCGHHYGRPMSSSPNEHGYCHWCREEGVYDKESEARISKQWEDFHRRQREREEAEYRRLNDADDGWTDW